MKIGYARVSTREQLLSMQVEAIKEAGRIQIHEEIASGAKTARPVLDEIMRNLREGDTLVGSTWQKSSAFNPSNHKVN